MVTPFKSMRLFLSPSPGARSQVAQKLSPSPSLTRNALSVPKVAQKSVMTKLFTTSRARKKLEYSFQSPKSALKPNVNVNVIAKSPIKKAKHSLILNTPNKTDILRSGLKSLGELTILGRGAFGTVVRGSYSGKDVAIKVLKTTTITNEQNALTLSHANVVKTIDVIVKNEQHSIIVTEYLPDSQVLQSVVDNEHCKLHFDEIIRHTLDITAGLIYIHSQGILHLDVKPANVLVTQGGCKICDFGSSRLVGSQANSLEEHNYGGTVQYTAPELLTGCLPNYACDTYSLSILMWQLRYRDSPYRYLGCRDTIIYNVVKHGLRPRAASRMEVDDDYSALYRSCWHSEPDKRPPLENIRGRLLVLIEDR